MISGAEVIELLPALADRAPTGGYLFYDCQTDDARLVLTVLAEAERFGAVAANRLEAVELLQDAGRAAGARVRDTRDRRRARGPRRERRQRDRRVGRPAAAVRAARRGRGPRSSARAAASHLVVDGAALPMSAGAIVPGRRGPHDLRAPVARPDADRHDGHRPRRRHRPRAPVRRRDRVPARRRQRVLRHVAERVRPGRCLRRRAAADLERRPREVGRHLAQGRAVRDLVAGWSRSPAASSRPGGGWPSRPSTGSSSATARTRAASRTRSRSGWRSRPRILSPRPAGSRAQLAGRYGHLAHDVLALAATRPELAEPIVPDRPDLLAEAAYAARREQARTVGDVAAAADAARAHRRPRAAGARGGRDRARRGRDGGGARLGRSAARPRGRGVPRRGARRGHPARAVTFRPRRARQVAKLPGGARRATPP